MNALEVYTHIYMSEMRNTSIEDLKQMLADEDFSGQMETGTSPIHAVACIEHDLVDYAIERGADVNVRNSEGYTPLDIAVPDGNEDIVASLLRNNARTDTADRYGNSPLLTAILSGPKAYKIVDMLIDAGADTDFITADGRSVKNAAQELNHPSFGRL